MYKLNTEQREQIKLLYETGLGVVAISRQTQTDRGTIIQILKDYKIWTPGVRPWKNIYNINSFKNYSRESCYWAGFILADGNLSSSRSALRICLNERDINHLNKLSDYLKYTGPIYNNSYNNSVNIHISGKWLTTNLTQNFDIFPQKSLTCIFSPKIPKEFYPDFIRGYFDGDGCITIGKRKNRPSPRLVIDFTGTYYVLSSISNIVYQELDINMPKIYTWKNRKVSRLAYSYRQALNILEWLYASSNESIRLTRKYQRYQNYIYSA